MNQARQLSSCFRVALAGLALLSSMPRVSAATPSSPEPKTRIVVLTDIGGREPDDEQSLIRLLVYANHFDIEALVANTSAWQPTDVHPELIRAVVEGYGKVRDNLMVHAPGFPTAESLLNVIRTGRAAVGMTGVGNEMGTEASRLIAEAIERRDPRPLWILAWGGATDFAQALWDLQKTRSAEEVRRLTAKLWVYDIAGQDDTGAWITHTYPEIRWLRSSTQFFGMSRRFDGTKKYIEARGGNESVMSREWIQENIQTHGTLGALYKHAAYIYEGDTPSFLHLLPTGLGDPEQAHFGSWGGRFTLEPRKNVPVPAVPRVTTQGKYHDYWMHADATDTWTYEGTTYAHQWAPLFRWREAFQHDFAARMDWTTTSDFRRANHNPSAALDGDPSRRIVYRTVRAGDDVRLSAAGSSDPDGNALAYEWFHYREPSTFAGELRLADRTAREVAFTAPDVSSPQTAHIILVVRDDGVPALFSYKRVIVTIESRSLPAPGL